MGYNNASTCQQPCCMLITIFKMPFPRVHVARQSVGGAASVNSPCKLAGEGTIWQETAQGALHAPVIGRSEQCQSNADDWGKMDVAALVWVICTITASMAALSLQMWATTCDANYM